MFVSVLTEMKTKSCTVFYTCFVCEQTHTYTHVYRQPHTPFTHPPTWYEVKRKKSTSTFSHPMFCDVARDVLSDTATATTTLLSYHYSHCSACWPHAACSGASPCSFALSNDKTNNNNKSRHSLKANGKRTWR